MTRSVAIVTGASSGIGRATAVRLAADFTALVLVARNAAELEAAAGEVRAAGAEALVVALDLASPGAALEVVERAVSKFARIDALVNVAGAVPGQDLFEMIDETWDAGLSLKFHGARRLTIAAWPALKAAAGSVVFVSGNAAENPRSGAAAIAAINAAIEALAKAFADRGLTDGVQVNSVSPGAVMTGRRLGMLQKAADARGVSLDEVKQGFLKSAGLARFGEPREVAELMAYLVSPAARWMTGSVVRIDGGEVKSV